MLPNSEKLFHKVAQRKIKASQRVQNLNFEFRRISEGKDVAY